MPTRCIAISRTKCESSVSPERPGVSRERSAKSTSVLQRGMLRYIAFRQLQQHRLKGNSVSCLTLYCSFSTVAYKPRTNVLKSVVKSTTQFACVQRMLVAANAPGSCRASQAHLLTCRYQSGAGLLGGTSRRRRLSQRVNLPRLHVSSQKGSIQKEQNRLYKLSQCSH